MSARVSIERGWWWWTRLEQHLILASRFEMRRTSGHVFLTSLLILLRRADAATEDSPEFSNKGTSSFHPLRFVFLLGYVRAFTIEVDPTVTIATRAERFISATSTAFSKRKSTSAYLSAVEIKGALDDLLEFLPEKF